MNSPPKLQRLISHVPFIPFILLDVFAPGSYSQFAKLSSIKEESGVPEWKDMVAQLVEGHEIVAANARDTIKSANAAGDDGTADMITGRLMDHEKTAWMLRSLLR